MIALHGVYKSFKSSAQTVKVLDGITLSVQKGEFLAIIGPSGSGKTTLTHIIGGLSKPDRGEVLIDGQNIAQNSDRHLSRYRNHLVGFVFQNYSLLPHYTALENVMIPLLLAKTPRREAVTRAQKILQTVGLGPQQRQQAHELSGGQRQRVAIARALVNTPRIIIADEPTGSLDSNNGEEIASLLQHLNKDTGATVLLVTHNLDLAKRADRIIHIHDGKIQGGRS